MKRCSSCNEIKTQASFYVRMDRYKTKQGYKRTRPRLRSECKSCYNAAAMARYFADKTIHRKAARKFLLKKYGLSVEEFDVLVAAQKGACKICGKAARLHVDHNHTTGHVRGLLCRTCNIGLGHFNDRLDLLQAAITYLRESENAG